MQVFDAERRIVGKQVKDRLDEIFGTIYEKIPIEGWRSVKAGHRQGPGVPPKSGWEPFEVGSVWGNERDLTVWFSAEITIPERFAGRKVALLVRPGSECLAYINGLPAQGLDGNRDEIVLTERARGSETYKIDIEAYTSARFDQRCIFEYAYLAAVNDEVKEFYWDGMVLLDVVQALPERSTEPASGQRGLYGIPQEGQGRAEERPLRLSQLQEGAEDRPRGAYPHRYCMALAPEGDDEEVREDLLERPQIYGGISGVPLLPEPAAAL